MTVHLPSAVQSLKFTPKHLSALTINIRMYEAERNIYSSLDEIENAAKIGVWFKLTSVAHCNDEFEHVSYTLLLIRTSPLRSGISQNGLCTRIDTL